MTRHEPQERRAATFIAVAFSVSIAAFLGLAVVYVLGGRVELEGALLFAGLGGLAAGLVVWSRTLMPHGIETAERPLLPSELEAREAAERTFAGRGEHIGRRRLLGRLLGAALAALGAAALFPIRSLGSRPGSALEHTSWRAGRRAVTPDGAPVLAASLVENTVLTVFPEGALDEADSQTLLIKMPPGSLRLPPERESWTPESIVAYSKICTHAGCPVGLYQVETAELFCPCHQSAFTVPNGARPVSGPATRPLPQLPLAIDAEGYVVAQGDFEAPVGPAFWRRGGS